MFEPRAADLDLVDLENALVRGAVGDYADEATVLLLINSGHWLPQLQSADLVALAPDIDGEGRWAQIAWPDVGPALAAGLIAGSGGQLSVLRAAASVADGLPVDLGDLAGRLDRRELTLVLAAVAHAAGSHDHHRVVYGQDELAAVREPLPPLVAWPVGT